MRLQAVIMWNDMDLVLLAANEHSQHQRLKRSTLQLTSTRTATSVRFVSSKGPMQSLERVAPMIRPSATATTFTPTPTSPRAPRQRSPPSTASNKSGSSSDDDAPFGLQQLQGIASGLLKIARLHT
jgi:hypothetical protein